MWNGEEFLQLVHHQDEPRLPQRGELAARRLPKPLAHRKGDLIGQLAQLRGQRVCRVGETRQFGQGGGTQDGFRERPQRVAARIGWARDAVTHQAGIAHHPGQHQIGQ